MDALYRHAGDSDGDGVPDDRDACPRDVGESSDDPMRNGCARLLDVEPIVDRLPALVFFPKNASRISKENDAVIAHVVSVLRQTPSRRCIAVVGHASSDEDATQKLSEERASAVRSAIIGAGSDGESIIALGDGVTTISDSPETNRFVDFRDMGSTTLGICP